MNAPPRIVRRPVPGHWRALADAGESPLLARLYAARGIATPQDLRGDLASLPAWQSMKNLAEAADRLVTAIRGGEPIVIIADYDADGATACALGIEGLRRLGAKVGFLVPNRFEYGYGLTPEIVELAAEARPRLIITVDNGIASLEGVARATALGIDVVITDHHLPGEALPASRWIVNPNQPGCTFPTRMLAGVGVMFYVLLAVRARLRELGDYAGQEAPRLADLLDLVAVGTVADVVPLDATNRTLVGHGLQRIRAGRARPGLAALFRVAARDPARATAFDLGFVCGPRINAAGRLADMTTGIDCLLATDDAAADRLAGRLDALNRERRAIEAEMRDAAVAQLAEAESALSGPVSAGGHATGGFIGDAAPAGDAFTVCLFDPGWHQGVVGIVASRMKDRLHRPAMVFAPGGDGTLRGSGRSIPALHLRDAIDLVAKRHPGLILRFGGHAAAAGVTLAADGLRRFADAFEEAVRSRVTVADLEREIATDGSLPTEELTLATAADLRGRVWGQGFAQPAFDDRFSVIDQRVVGSGHLRLTLARDGRRFPAILFNRSEPLPKQVRAVYRPDVNDWRGTESLQLIVDHWFPE